VVLYTAILFDHRYFRIIDTNNNETENQGGNALELSRDNSGRTVFSYY
jgi:hypothetical protein